MSARRPPKDPTGKWLLPIVVLLALGVGVGAYIAVQRVGDGDVDTEESAGAAAGAPLTLGADVPEPPGDLGYRPDPGVAGGDGSYAYVAERGDPRRAAKGLVSFYQRQMPDKGWEVVVVPGSGPGGTLVFRKDEAYAGFQISDDAHARITLCPPAPKAKCGVPRA